MLQLNCYYSENMVVQLLLVVTIYRKCFDPSELNFGTFVFDFCIKIHNAQICYIPELVKNFCSGEILYLKNLFLNNQKIYFLTTT
ncbi:hypothetical protein BpHYR1_046422 [Brachionus plicatilis]|uniref:Uncharacterized protein n=1 Tax=Brachionus plicatilis TaxID=10195 RepID=A0A3M7PP73_BRAPC|nr:hypothetical protein BpHYR1_046422 [Brachionus plicatilis]